MSDDGDSTDSFDLANPGRINIGATRGEFDLEIGGPREYPDRADVSVRPAEGARVMLTIDATAGDHATGHADVELALDDARTLRDVLEETIRWIGAEEKADEGSKAQAGLEENGSNEHNDGGNWD